MLVTGTLKALLNSEYSNIIYTVFIFGLCFSILAMYKPYTDKVIESLKEMM